MLEFFYNYFERPIFLLIGIVLCTIVFLLMRINFFKDIKILGKKATVFEENKIVVKHKIFGREISMHSIVLALRLVVILLLCAALAYPYISSTKIVEGEPKVKILFDNSSSMQLYKTDFVYSLRDKIGEQVTMDFAQIANGEVSALGDGLLSYIRMGENVLLISDGNVNRGIFLEDAAVHAKEVNATINIINLSAIHYDASVSISGPEKTTSMAENKFVVHLEQNMPRDVTVKVYIDNALIDEKTGKESFSFTKTFEAGKHKIKAEIDGNDYFVSNNIFYKTIKVVPKPKVLFVSTKESTLLRLFEPVYDVKLMSDLNGLNSGLEEYSAIVLNDLSYPQLKPYIDKLSNFAVEGSGLFIIGGINSYESGGYEGSRLEQILPIVVGAGTKKKGDVNIAVIIDISGSTGASFAESTTIDVEKALSVGVLRDLSLVNNVGVVAFNDKAYVVENVSLLLSKSEKDIEDRILRLRDGGATLIGAGLLLAHEQLQGLKGSKNIILISDGKTQDRDGAEQAANFAASRGTRIYTVGVGEDTDADMMNKIADIGGGNYFQPTTRQNLKLIFGETEIAGDRRLLPVSVFDKSHFITDDLEVKANIYGFNQVVPKQSAKLLVTTDAGDPLLVVGRWGLGRIAVFASDDGGLYAGELLGKSGSRVYTKSMNWLIGDPERKNDYFLSAQDGYLGGNVEALLKSSIRPGFKTINFIKFDEDMYKAIIPANETGFFDLGEVIYAVNYNNEYLHPAISPSMENIVKTTGGKVFNPENVDDIIAYIKTSSKKEVYQNINIAWIFALIALLLYVGEVCYRRIVRNFYKQD